MAVARGIPKRNEESPSPPENTEMNATQIDGREHHPPYFCHREECDLHIDMNADNGAGNWATLPNGLIVGRICLEHRYYCDRCARDLIRA